MKKHMSIITLLLAALHSPAHSEIAPPQSGTSSEYGNADMTFTTPDNDVIPAPSKYFPKVPVQKKLQLNYEFLKKRSAR